MCRSRGAPYERGYMRWQPATGCALVIALLWLAGCQTLGDVMQEKARGGGSVQVYPVNPDQAWLIAMMVFHWEGSDTIEEHRAEGYMLTSSGMNLITGTWGTVMGAWIEPVGQGQTQVTVVTKRRSATNL